MSTWWKQTLTGLGLWLSAGIAFKNANTDMGWWNFAILVVCAIIFMVLLELYASLKVEEAE